METDKSEETEKKKRELSCFTGGKKNHHINSEKFWFLLFSSKVWLHQGEWEDHVASREGETRDCCFPRDHHHSEWMLWLPEHFNGLVSPPDLRVSLQVSSWIQHLIPKIEDGNDFGVAIQVNSLDQHIS